MRGVLLEEPCQLGVHARELELVDADDERRQPVDLLAAHAERHNLPAVDHAVEDGSQFLDRAAEPTRSGLRGFRDGEQLQRQGGIVGGEDLFEDAQLDPALRAGEAVRELVQLRRETFVDIVHVGCSIASRARTGGVGMW